jgi:uncharacterized protein (DUF1501 family)
MLRFTRRRLLSDGLALGFGGLGLGLRPSPADAAVGPSPKKKVLVLIFQRGAADGLAMVAPIGDPDYAKARPTIALAVKGDQAALPLEGGDSLFGLHPALAPLKPLYDDGLLAIVHQAGSPDTTRSHFDAQDFMETGTPGDKATEDGFLNRALGLLPAPGEAISSTLRAIAIQPTLPRALRGARPALAMNSVRDFAHGALDRPALRGGFESMYQGALDEALRGVGEEAFRAVRVLRDSDAAAAAGPGRGPKGEPAKPYPGGALGKRLSEIARLIKADLGLTIAATEAGGWDTHVRQGGARGPLADRLKELGQAIGAFAADLGPRLDEVCVVTITEFGRTVRENGSQGTDHGHGSVMMLLGGGIAGRRVLSRWRGLGAAELFEGRDLAVVHDYRAVMLEVLGRHLGLAARDRGRVFPGYASAGLELGLFRGLA